MVLPVWMQSSTSWAGHPPGSGSGSRWWPPAAASGRDATFLRRLLTDILFREGVFLQFDVVAVGEEFAVPAGGGEASSILPRPHCMATSPFRQADMAISPSAWSSKQLAVDAGAVVEALLVAGRGEVGEVLVSLHVLAEQDQVVGRVGDPFGVLWKRDPGDVDLAADDRLDAGLLAFLGRTPTAPNMLPWSVMATAGIPWTSRLDQVVKPDGAVEQRILGMEVEMGEGHGRGGPFYGLRLTRF